MKKLISILLAAVIVLLPMAGIALPATEERDLIPIHEVNILGFVPPEIGSTPEFSYTLYVEEGSDYFIIFQYWFDNTIGSNMTTEQTPFLPNHMYSIGGILAPNEGYVFADDCVFMFNGDPSLVDQEYFEEFYLFDGCFVVQTVPTAPVDPNAVLPGDADLNGVVDISDALLALRAAMGLMELTPEQIAAADVTDDGEVDVQDALVILRMSMGLID